MKKKVFIVLTNILLLVVAAGLIEFFSYLKYDHDIKYILNEYRSVDEGLKLEYLVPLRFDIEIFRKWFKDRTDYSDKQGILILGSSYVAGTRLADEQTFDYKLHKVLKRPTYRRATPGGGPQYAYYMFQSGLLEKEAPNVKYVVFVYNPEHIFMLDSFQVSPVYPVVNLRYKVKDGELIQTESAFYDFYSLFSVRNMQSLIEKISFEKMQRENKIYDNFNVMIKAIVESSKKLYPDSEFVFLVYPAHKSTFPRYANPKDFDLPTSEIEYLKSLGCKVVDLNALIGGDLDAPKYKSDDKSHPSAKVWEEVVPALIKNKIIN